MEFYAAQVHKSQPTRSREWSLVFMGREYLDLFAYSTCHVVKTWLGLESLSRPRNSLDSLTQQSHIIKSICFRKLPQRDIRVQWWCRQRPGQHGEEDNMQRLHRHGVCRKVSWKGERSLFKWALVISLYFILCTFHIIEGPFAFINNLCEIFVQRATLSQWFASLHSLRRPRSMSSFLRKPT